MPGEWIASEKWHSPPRNRLSAPGLLLHLTPRIITMIALFETSIPILVLKTSTDLDFVLQITIIYTNTNG